MSCIEIRRGKKKRCEGIVAACSKGHRGLEQDLCETVNMLIREREQLGHSKFVSKVEGRDLFFLILIFVIMLFTVYNVYFCFRENEFSEKKYL